MICGEKKIGKKEIFYRSARPRNAAEKGRAKKSVPHPREVETRRYRRASFGCLKIEKAEKRHEKENRRLRDSKKNRKKKVGKGNKRGRRLSSAPPADSGGKKRPRMEKRLGWLQKLTLKAGGEGESGFYAGNSNSEKKGEGKCNFEKLWK